MATWCPPFGVSNIQGTNPLFLRTYVEYLFYSQAGRLPPGSDRAGMMHHNGFFLIAPALNGMTRMLNLRFALDSDGGTEERTGCPGGVGAIMVDASSALEAAVGHKDPTKDFVLRAKRAALGSDDAANV